MMNSKAREKNSQESAFGGGFSHTTMPRDHAAGCARNDNTLVSHRFSLASLARYAARGGMLAAKI